MDVSSEGLVIDGHSVRLQEKSGLEQDRHLVTTDMLPDEVLVDIFEFSESTVDPAWDGHNMWRAVVHVCQRWRYLVFASPRRLNLRLVYRGHRPMSEVLDAWPVLPVSLMSSADQCDQQWDNTIVALESEYSNCICELSIDVTESRWKRFAAAMQKPFPELTHLRVWTLDDVPVLQDLFLSGSAPRLRSLVLITVSFPSIPKFLLSANSLVELSLWGIRHSGHVSSNAIATALTGMTRLEILRLRFLSPISPPSRPDPASRPLLPLTRFVLPALTELVFKGFYKYLEDLLARINAPRLYNLCVIFFMVLDFDVPQLHRLIGHAEEFKTFDRANVWIYDRCIRLILHPNTVQFDDCARLELQINHGELDHQLSSLALVCSPPFPFISALEDLQIREEYSLSSSHWKDDMANARQLELLDPFTALKDLYLTRGIAQRFCGALHELSGERATEVLPTLRNIFVRGYSSLEPVEEALMPFIATRQLSGHPVVINHWED